MVSQTPEERMFYEARQKFLRDEESRIIAARREGIEQGIEQGIEKGTMAGQIRLLQQLLGDAQSSLSILTASSLPDLADQVEQLQDRLRRRDS